MENIKYIFYKNLYVGVPLSLEDLEIDWKEEDVELMDSLSKIYKKVTKEKLSYYRQLQNEGRIISKKIINPFLFLFPRKRKKIKERNKKVKEELLFKKQDMKNTKNAYFDSQQVISSVEKTLKGLYSIDKAILLKIEEQTLKYDKVCSFESLEGIEVDIEAQINEDISEHLMDLTSDATYYNVDCDGTSLDTDRVEREVRIYEERLLKEAKKEKEQLRKLFLEKENIKKERDKLVQRFVSENLKEKQIINYAVTGSVVL